MSDTELLTKTDLEELLRQKFGQVTVESLSISQLTQPGENYGANLLAVEVTLAPDHKKMSVVAKLVPVLLDKFNYITVRKEMDFYLLVSPAYRQIQEECQVTENEIVDLFPECYGARATRGPDVGQLPDDGAALLIENLRNRGYSNGNRLTGVDLAHTRLVMVQMARFHATAVALKINKPQVFQDTRGPSPKKEDDKAVKPKPYGPEQEYELIAKQMAKFPEFADKLERIKASVSKTIEQKASGKPIQPSEPFASILHDDLCVNNIMFCYEADKKTPKDLKIIDFQFQFYDSPAKDLLFFLFTSTEVGLVVDHYDDMVRLYHQTFTRLADHSPLRHRTILIQNVSHRNK
uniref:CHK kinase-like domain-containing protein n=1 Tax=Timema genevievae TaxID=629358 RepID=A0A7R9K2G9_TIMGE|nr:unnamed protein product [Timema genevievae]